MKSNQRIASLDAPLILFTAIMIIGASYMALIYAPTERTMGLIQRIFYFHVAAAWLSFLAFFIVFVASLLFLLKKSRDWDQIAVSSAKIGVIFCTLVLITGPIWAKPIWGIWWTWDARLTSVFVLWLVYIAYLMLRGYIHDPMKRGSLSAIIGIIGFLDVPFIYISIRWWRTQHPQPVMIDGEKSGLAPEMLVALLVSVAAFTLLYFVMMRYAIRLERVQDDIHHIYQDIQNRDQ
ncbi:MAG: cytochrome C assembly protein [Candidatus Cloacimonetes bacterium 4572_55]|nr:MAG: cytochrome C assembly protein [Candidatus Cloacimonetes bacterium 4572_55]